MLRPILISLCLTSTALATTWTVDDDGKADFNNIQAAVDAASDGDEIVVMPGTYTGTGDAVIDMLGKGVTLRSTDHSNHSVVAATILNGENQRRVVVCDSGETNQTILKGFTIQNGYASKYPDWFSTPWRLGGGMLIKDSSPVVSYCIFINNVATWGGGVLCGVDSYVSSTTFNDCVFESNTTTLGGGGLYSFSGSCNITNCTFNNNFSTSIDAWGGGMVFQWGSGTIDDCVVINNDSNGAGGGIYIYESSVHISNSILCSNDPSQISGGWTDGGGNILTSNCLDICPDINADGFVGVTDLLAVLDAWGESNLPSDVSYDGVVDGEDLLIVVGSWGPCE